MIIIFSNLISYINSQIWVNIKTNFGKPFMEEYWYFWQIVIYVICVSKLANIFPTFSLNKEAMREKWYFEWTYVY